MGADRVLNVAHGRDPRALAAEVGALLDGKLPDVTIDCVGFEASVQLGIYVSILQLYFHLFANIIIRI